MVGLISKIRSDPTEKVVKKFKPLVEQINALEPGLERLSDDDLRNKTQEFKGRLEKGERLDELLPEAFAVVREASKRTLGQRHFDVQLIGGVVLHRGQIAEMKTGEGKTLGGHAARLPKCPGRPWRPCGDGQRLFGSPGPRVDEPHISPAWP